MEEQTQKHRLTSINEIRGKLKQEIFTCDKSLKKYQKIYNVVNGICISAGSMSGSASIVTLTTLANPLITAPSAAASAILGAVAFSTGLWNRIILNKVRKYEDYLSTAQSKLNSIEQILSQSLDDTKISADEHLTCLAEFENYNKLKQEIRRKFRFTSIKNKSSKNGASEHLQPHSKTISQR